MRKRLTALFLCACTCFSLLSCGKNAFTQEDELPSFVIGGAMHDPYFYTDKNGEYSGIDVAIAKEACARMGYTPVFKEIEWVQKNELLQKGEIDCVWTCFSMNGREELYDWAGPYAQDREVVAVLKDSDIYTLDDLENKKVAVQMTSKAEDILLSSSNPSIPPLCQVFSLYDMAESVSFLRRELVDACVGHEAPLKAALGDLSVEYRMLDEPVLITQTGVAFRKGKNGDIRMALDHVFDEMQKDGTIREILRRYGVEEGGAL